VPDEQAATALVDQVLHPSWLLAAEDGALTFQFTTPLLVATVAAVVLWVLLLLGVAFATRARGVDPGPATMELGEEPPAVVDLLTNDWRVTADAIPATLLDLAARGYLDLEQYGPGCTVCRVRRTSGEGLEAYERMVLEHVAGLAVDGVVPAEALTTVHRRCQYRAASGGGSVSVFTAAGDLVRLLVRVNRRFGEAVPGVGDEAFLRGDMIAVVRGEVAVSIRLQGGQVADRPAALRQLATTAAGRLAEPSTRAPASPEPA
jgi:hypothetical protein